MNSSANLAPLRIGLCGLGYGLKHFDSLLKSPHAARIDLRAVCDLRADRRQKFKKPGYETLDQMLAEADIEAVALFTGPAGRANLIRKAIRAGKDVMTTKPFELSAAEAIDVLGEARSLGRTVFLNSPAPVLGEDIRQILKWQRAHNLGRLIFARCDSWYRAIESPDGSWYDDPRQCPVAPIFRLGIYGINDILALVEGQIMEVQVLQDRVLTGRPTPDVAQLGIRFSQGTVACVRATWCCGPIRDNQVSEFVFERGTISRTYSTRDHRTAAETILTLDAVDLNERLFSDEARISNLVVNSAYRWDIFHAAVRGLRTDDLLSAEQIVAGIRVVERMKQAVEAGGLWRVAPSV